MKMAEVILIMPHLLLKVQLFLLFCGNLSAHFTVFPPEVHISPTEVQTTEGKTVEFFCRAHGLGANSFTYQWFFNDLLVTGQTTPNLVISEVSEGNAGDYVCFVRNSYGGIGQSEIARLILGK